MTLSKDWREFLELLNSRGVDYVIVGAQSLAFHGRPRHTGDLDILVRPTPDNALLLLALLNQFGFEQSSFKETDFLQPEQIIQLGRVPSRIDLLTSLTGVTTRRSIRRESVGYYRRPSCFRPWQRRIDTEQASGRSATGSRGPRRTRGLIFHADRGLRVSRRTTVAPARTPNADS